MNVVRWLQPRDHARAARTISTLGMVAAGVTIAFAIVQPGTRESTAITVLTVAITALIGVGAWMVRYVRATHQVIWATCPLLAIALIVVLDVLTSDHSVSAQ